jgi:hypothetical protein
LSARLRYLRCGSDGESLSHVNLQLLRKSSHTLAMTTAAGGASAICVWNSTTLSRRGHAGRPSHPLTSLPLTSTERRCDRGGRRRKPRMGLLERWRCTIWGQAARSVQSPLETQHLRTEVKWKRRGEEGGGSEGAGANLLRDKVRRRLHATTPDASTTGFSSHVRKRREGRAVQNDRSARRLQLRGTVKRNHTHASTHTFRARGKTRTCNPTAGDWAAPSHRNPVSADRFQHMKK